MNPRADSGFVVSFFLETPLNFNDKIIVVTGCGRRIGAGIVERFLVLGAEVAGIEI